MSARMATSWQAHAGGRSSKEFDEMVEAANEASSASSYSPVPARPALPAAWVSALTVDV